MRTCQTVGSVRSAARKGRMLSTGLVVWCCNILCRYILLECMFGDGPQNIYFSTLVLLAN
jgi:hypothetical protein